VTNLGYYTVNIFFLNYIFATVVCYLKTACMHLQIVSLISNNFHILNIFKSS